MQIRRLQVFEYKVPLIEPLVFSWGRINERHGCAVTLVDDRDRRGWGEASPLPGFGHDLVQSVVRDLHQFRDLLPLDMEEFWTASAGCCAPVNFALNAAIADLEADPVPQGVKINALLAGFSKDWKIEAARLKDQGCTCIKFKVGREAVETELEALAGVRDLLGPGGGIRLDANRAWEFEEALAFLNGAADLKPDYVEEPLRDASDLEILARETPVPVALDESLAGPHRISTIPAWAGAAVLKPTLLGDGPRLEHLLGRARKHGTPTVISSCFESGIGLAGLLRIVGRWGLETTVHGLDTWRLLRDDLLSEAPTVTDGRLYFPLDRQGRVPVDPNLLEPVTP